MSLTTIETIVSSLTTCMIGSLFLVSHRRSICFVFLDNRRLEGRQNDRLRLILMVYSCSRLDTVWLTPVQLPSNIPRKFMLTHPSISDDGRLPTPCLFLNGSGW